MEKLGLDDDDAPDGLLLELTFCFFEIVVLLFILQQFPLMFQEL